MVPRPIAPPYTRKVMAAIVGNPLVAATKFAAAAWTGSSAMLRKAVHSIVGFASAALRSAPRQGAAGPRSSPRCGREVYFWSFAVTVMVFAPGAGVPLWSNTGPP
jgi:hypothetical protein